MEYSDTEVILEHMSPVVVVGSSRSGTSLVSGILHACGCHMGYVQSNNNESKLFQNINRDILDIIGASWRCLDPLPDVEVLYNKYEYLSDIMRCAIQSHIAELDVQTEILSDQVWGWKDPRSSLTLPLWRRVFPKARILHVVRDGRVAALSLKKREDHRHASEYQTYDAAKERFEKDVNVWREYLLRITGAASFFEINTLVQYEHLVENPLETVRRMLRELHLREPENLEQIVNVVRQPDSVDYSDLSGSALEFEEFVSEVLAFVKARQNSRNA